MSEEWTLEQAEELDANLIQAARDRAGSGATQSQMRDARATYLQGWLNKNTSARHGAPDNTYTPYGRRSVKNLSDLLAITEQEPTVVTVINAAYDEIVFLRRLAEDGTTLRAENELMASIIRDAVIECEMSVRLSFPLQTRMRNALAQVAQ